MVDCLTDNRTRTVADVRHAFAKNGGNLGTTGRSPIFSTTVASLFCAGAARKKVMDAALEAGATIWSPMMTVRIESCARRRIPKVREALRKGLKPDGPSHHDNPPPRTELAGDDAARCRSARSAGIIDDVQNVYTHCRPRGGLSRDERGGAAENSRNRPRPAHHRLGVIGKDRREAELCTSGCIKSPAGSCPSA